MNGFLRGHRVLAVKKEFVPDGLTNGQLAQVVQKKITSKAGLKEIEGVGEARMEKYGEALLRQLWVPEGASTS